MKENEKNVEETTSESETNDEELETNDEDTEKETQDEETNEETEEEEEDDEEQTDSDTPTLEDYERLQKELKTLKAQKEHWRKKATLKPEKKEEINKVNQENSDFEEAMDIRFLKRDGYSEEDIEKLRIIKAGYASKGKNISLLDAVNDDLFKSIEEKRKLEEKKNKAQLSSSGRPLTYSKKEMTPEEFEKFRQSKSKEFLKNMGFNA